MPAENARYVNFRHEDYAAAVLLSTSTPFDFGTLLNLTGSDSGGDVWNRAGG